MNNNLNKTRRSNIFKQTKLNTMRVKLITLRNSVLKEILEEYGLPVSGNKNEMVCRLQEHIGSDEIEQGEGAECQSNEMMQQQIDEIKLLLGRLSIGMQNLTAQRENIPTPFVPTPTSNTETVSVNVDTPMTQPVRSFSVKEIAETIPVFDPTDHGSLTVERFVDRVDQIRLTYNFNEKSLLLAVYSRMKGAARLWMDALPTLFATWTSFAEALCNEFQEELDETAIHNQMEKTTRQVDETPADYCFRISAVGKRYGLTDRAIIRHARSGIRNREFQTAIAPLRIDNMRKFRETVVEFFDNSKPSMQQQSSRPKFNAMNSNSGRENVAKAKYVKQESGRLICYNCAEEGHISAKCPKPQKIPRCKDCGRVHKKGEPTHCGKNLKVNKLAKVSGMNEKEIEVLDTTLKADIDTGSECDLIKRSVANKFKRQRKPCHVKITGIGGGSNLSTEYVNLPVRVDNANVELQFYVVSDEVIETDVLIGQPIFRDKTIRMTIQNGNIGFEKTFNVETTRVRDKISVADINCSTNEPDVIDKLIQLTNEYRQIFATDMTEIGKTDWEVMHIKLKSPNVSAQAPYRIPEKKKEIVDEMIRELLECDIIEKSSSNYASPILLHKKKTGGERLCVDYRRLNSITEHEIFPMPNIEESLHEVKRFKYFSVLDLNSGYYQVPIDPGSRKYTAFITTKGLYQFKRMPFGLRNAPTVFLRLMAKINERLQPGDMTHYMDDMIVGSNTLGEMLEKLERVFKALLEAGLTLNIKKCEFMKKTITYLGHELNPDGISPGQVKTKAIEDFPTPKNVTDIRKFLGLSGYFRKFVPGYAIRSEPLRKLLRKDAKFQWTGYEEEAFNDLKKALMTNPVMTSYNSELEHAIHTDASSAGLAAVLMQKEEGDQWKPVIYYSRSTTDLERKYHSSELETLAVVEALERFKYYVYGKPIKVLTDCAAVKSTTTKRDLIPRIGRWSLRIQEFDAIIEHRPGNRMEHVDCLSRAPTGPAEELEEATLRVDKIGINEADWLSAIQLADPKIQTKINELTKANSAEDDQFIVKDNRLFRKIDDRQLWVVPKALRWKILHDCHDNAGHLALENTLLRIKTTMWFAGMRNFAKSYLKACIECSYNKHNNKQTEGEYHCDDIPLMPFKTVHLDHLGPFPKSRSRNEHLLVLVDAFTKFTVIRAVPNTKTKFVLRVLNEVNGYFGTPERIVTDRGTAFTSKEFEKYCDEHNIKHVKNAVRTPRANGHAERTNRTILSMLLPSCENDRNWDEEIPTIQWSINTLRNKTTKKTPQELLYSFTPRDVVKNKLILALHHTDCMTQEEMDEVRKEAVEGVKAIRAEAVKRYNAKRRTTTKYKIGDLVLVENEPPSTGTSRKLEPRYKGPFQVTAVLGHDRYVVEDIPGSNRKQKHYSSVYASDKMRLWNVLPPDTDSDDDSEANWSEDAPIEQERPNCKTSDTTAVTDDRTAKLQREESVR